MWLDAMVLFPLALLGIDSLQTIKAGMVYLCINNDHAYKLLYGFHALLFCIPYFFVSLFTGKLRQRKRRHRVIPAKTRVKKPDRLSDCCVPRVLSAA
jgi:uncharacterized membrane protein YfhO